MEVRTWREAENLAARWMRENGWRDAAVTNGGADAGIDVRARGAIAQVKFEARPVGRPAVQRLVGARGNASDTTLIFFALNGFTREAVTYADDLKVGLLGYTTAGDVRLINSAARRIARGASTGAIGRSTTNDVVKIRDHARPRIQRLRASADKTRTRARIAAREARDAIAAAPPAKRAAVEKRHTKIVARAEKASTAAADQLARAEADLAGKIAAVRGENPPPRAAQLRRGTSQPGASRSDNADGDSLFNL